ncbi:metal ABC transporter permease [Desulfitobacterium metallireducens]|uniref:Metal ABC transporter permease n=1 Tax=Desulfitobacterium metallireducens DSM 15288 TaxID=871968 RepID=W0EAG7_9FIRM|nr:metal ABC transporter permease [Desulfitobacterium metallireducens]AHF06528.1 metal ABC transporter permease [Desulfitobacterium metallireducens DSM 15288]
MLDIFQYDFMQRAFITGILIAIITPCIGVIVVLKRLSMTGDALSHNSLAGVAAGLVLGVNPILGAVVFSIVAAFGIEKVRKSFPQYSEIAIAIIMSTGIGLAGILSGFVKNSANFNSFLFGSIVAISDFELYMVIALSIIVILAFTLLFKELFYMTFDEESARLAGIPIKGINFVFTLLTAVTISVSARTVGTLVISSLMVLPVATAMQIAQSYKQTVVYAILFALFFTIAGLYISYYANFKPGGTIVLVGVLTLIIVLLSKNVSHKKLVKKTA